MKEITRVTTVTITEILKESDSVVDILTLEASKQKYKETMYNLLKDALPGVDNVSVERVQDFVNEEVE